jgi:hypothetical protein
VAVQARASGYLYGFSRCDHGQVLEDWGLHLIDANLTMGNLIAIVGDETKAYLARAKK